MNLVHLEKMKQWVSDMEVDPTIKWQYRNKESQLWSDITYTPMWNPGCEYRRKPQPTLRARIIRKKTVDAHSYNWVFTGTRSEFDAAVAKDGYVVVGDVEEVEGET